MTRLIQSTATANSLLGVATRFLSIGFIHMQLIEISADTFINRDSICSVQVFARSQTKRENLGFGMQSSPKKIGETFTMSIVTSDGATHSVSEEFSQQVHDVLFPESAV